ncbi:hypothetical protein [Tychonema sp. LEGE 07203]|uniref:hypothetical protein n=1 Tax=Tychonema sp. LEGE 07203 TaxID=1828671 RepID=UPI001D134977|nr:hypothetical protein [Tychonema sp. LEGE 07203]
MVQDVISIADLAATPVRTYRVYLRYIAVAKSRISDGFQLFCRPNGTIFCLVAVERSPDGLFIRLIFQEKMSNGFHNTLTDVTNAEAVKKKMAAAGMEFGVKAEVRAIAIDTQGSQVST